MQQCQFVCRSCLLRLGQPQRKAKPLQSRQLRQFLPQVSNRALTTGSARAAATTTDPVIERAADEWTQEDDKGFRDQFAGAWSENIESTGEDDSARLDRYTKAPARSPKKVPLGRLKYKYERSILQTYQGTYRRVWNNQKQVAQQHFGHERAQTPPRELKKRPQLNGDLYPADDKEDKEFWDKYRQMWPDEYDHDRKYGQKYPEASETLPQTYAGDLPRVSKDHEKTTVQPEKFDEGAKVGETMYPPGDKELWDKYDEIWAEDIDGRKHEQTNEAPTGIVGPLKDAHWKGTTRATELSAPREAADEVPSIGHGSEEAAKEKASKRQTFKKKRRVLRGQLAHLYRLSDVNSFPEEQAMFYQWKSRLKEVSALLQREDAHPSRASPEWQTLLECEDLDSMKASWASQPAGYQRCHVVETVCSALMSTPEKVHVLLEVIFQNPIPPSYIYEDTLQLLARSLRQMDDKHQASYAKDLCNLVIFILEHSEEDYARLSQNTIFSILRSLGHEQAEKLYRQLVSYRLPLHKYTLLQFASRFANAVETKRLALDILRYLLETNNLEINEPLGASICTSILAVKESSLEVDDNASATPAELFQTLVDCGLRPNVITYTSIIRNLCLKMDLPTAWQVFEIMRQHNIEPDAHLYSVMINGSKLNDDYDSVRRVIVMAIEANVRDPVVLNDLVHSIFLCCMTETRRKGLKVPRMLPAFGPMLKMYAKFFRKEPLKALVQGDIEVLEGVPLPNWSFVTKLRWMWAEIPSLPEDQLLEPSSSTLGMMIMGFVKGFSKPYDVIAFYSNFRDLLRTGDPMAELIVREQGSLVHDIVIKALLEWQGMLRVALDVVSDMLKDVPVARPLTWPGPSAAAAAAEARKTRHPAPSVHTWSILLHGFLHYKMHRQGEVIMKVMKEHGVTPNVVTWNTLAAGYSRFQFTKMAVNTMRRLETAGFQSDDFTLRAFGYLVNKKAAVELMEAAVEHNRQLQEKQAQRKHKEAENPEGYFNSHDVSDSNDRYVADSGLPNNGNVESKSGLDSNGEYVAGSSLGSQRGSVLQTVESIAASLDRPRLASQTRRPNLDFVEKNWDQHLSRTYRVVPGSKTGHTRRRGVMVNRP